MKAVDGIDLDILRGQIVCLVGESGCGKTTTGKALLRLIEPTEGDVLFEMPEGDFRRYDEALHRPDEPLAATTLEDLRRKYSLSWTERAPWSRAQLLTTGFAAAVAFLLAVALPSLIAAAFGASLTANAVVFASSIGVGLILGGIGLLPPTRPSRRTADALALLALPAVNLLPVVGPLLSNAISSGASIPFDAGGAFGSVWGAAAFGMIFAQIFAPGTAAVVSRLILERRLRSEGLTGIKMRSLRRRLHLIFQDPYESLNPKQSVFEIVSEPLKVNRITKHPEETIALVVRALNDAGLRPAEEFLYRFPHELSGGQRQRVSIAAALVLEPDFIVADEPVSMLDVSIRTDILQLLLDLREKKGLTYLFITHDLGLAWVIADRIAVMYLGKIVETGSAEQVIGQSKHPYTRALISVVPSPDPRKRVERTILKGERPDPVNIPSGCRFHPRCPVAFEPCGWTADEIVEELQSLQGHGMLTEMAAIQAQDPNTIGIAPVPGVGPEALAETLRSFVSENRSTHLALKGIADVHVSQGFVYASMHSGREPPLIELSPGNAAACHLITPPAETDRPITA